MTTLEVFLLVFMLVLLLLITERYHRSVAAMLGASLVMILGVEIKLFEWDALIEFIDFNTLLFIIGVMILCEGLARSGVFQFIGLKIVSLVKGNLRLLFAAFLILSVLLTALIGNITSMLVVGSLTLALGDELEIDVKKWVLAELALVDLGGIIFPISSIPSLIIASKMKWGFNDFVVNMGPIVLVLVGVTLLLIIREAPKKRLEHALKINPWSAVENKSVFYRAFIIFIGIIVLFCLSNYLKI